MVGLDTEEVVFADALLTSWLTVSSTRRLELIVGVIFKRMPVLRYWIDCSRNSLCPNGSVRRFLGGDNGHVVADADRRRLTAVGNETGAGEDLDLLFDASAVSWPVICPLLRMRL